MNDLAKDILKGGWPLVAGWILPTAVNLVLFGLFLASDLTRIDAVRQVTEGALGKQSLAVLTGAVVLGLLLNSLQTPLYRILEGYLGWPLWAYRWGVSRQLRRRELLRSRLRAVTLAVNGSNRPLTEEETEELATLRADRRLGQHLVRDLQSGAPGRGLLRERLHRYPLADEQVVCTRLGNAIRRLEEYGYQRYRLDSQVFWYELNAVAPEQARQAVVDARISVDFFVCLLYGHLAVAAAAVGLQLGNGRPDPADSLLALVLTVLSVVWYRLAVAGTDDWAVATRSLVNLGRKPLAESLGLRLPGTLTAERDMWALVSKLTRLGYHDKAAALDRFRDDGPPGGTGQSGSAERPSGEEP